MDLISELPSGPRLAFEAEIKKRGLRVEFFNDPLTWTYKIRVWNPSPMAKTNEPVYVAVASDKWIKFANGSALWHYLLKLVLRAAEEKGLHETVFHQEPPDWAKLYDEMYSDYAQFYKAWKDQKFAPGGPKVWMGGQVVTKLKAVLPGLGELAKHPPTPDQYCFSGSLNAIPVADLIIHLNDNHKWTREQIADWLETLDVDLRFPTPKETEEEAA